jgi:hypothetical protein
VSRIPPVALFVASLLASAGATAWWAWPRPTPPPPRPEVCVQADDLAERLDRGRARLEQEIARLDKLRAEDARLTGVAPAWPADLPAALGADGVRAAVGRALAGAGVTVEGVDCEEYPCIVTARWAGAVDAAPPDPAALLRAAGLGAPAHEATVRASPTGRTALFAIALFGDPTGLGSGTQLRVQRRARAALAPLERSAATP